MTDREASWQVDSATLVILRTIQAAGHIVSVHDITPSLRGTQPAAVEMHALELATEQKYMVSVTLGEVDDE